MPARPSWQLQTPSMADTIGKSSIFVSCLSTSLLVKPVGYKIRVLLIAIMTFCVIEQVEASAFECESASANSFTVRSHSDDAG